MPLRNSEDHDRGDGKRLATHSRAHRSDRDLRSPMVDFSSAAYPGRVRSGGRRPSNAGILAGNLQAGAGLRYQGSHRLDHGPLSLLRGCSATLSNPVFQHHRHEWALAIDKGVPTGNFFFDPSSGKGVSLKSFPSGVSSAPVKIRFNGGSSSDVDLLAGFFGVRQDATDMTLSPLIGWCITEPAPKTPIEI